jgi:hypothetical protein
MQRFYAYDDDFREDTDPRTSEALCKYAEKIARYGRNSAQARAWYDQHKDLPEFPELATECDKLEARCRPAAPPTGLNAFWQGVRHAGTGAQVAFGCLLIGIGAAPPSVALVRQHAEAQRALARQQAEAQQALVIAKAEKEKALGQTNEETARERQKAKKALSTVANFWLNAAEKSDEFYRVGYPATNQNRMLSAGLDTLKTNPDLAIACVVDLAKERDDAGLAMLLISKIGQETDDPNTKAQAKIAINTVFTNAGNQVALSEKRNQAIAYLQGTADVTATPMLKE